MNDIKFAAAARARGAKIYISRARPAVSRICGSLEGVNVYKGRWVGYGTRADDEFLGTLSPDNLLIKSQFVSGKGSSGAARLINRCQMETRLRAPARGIGLFIWVFLSS